MGNNSDQAPQHGSIIVERQNEPAAIEQLAAQRQLYREAKRFDALRFWVSLALALASFALPHIGPSGTPWLRASTGLWLIFDLIVLRELARNLHSRAALIQEGFDTTVLVLPWNKVAAGEKPIYEYIVSAARRFFAQKGDKEQLKNWYPDVSRLPLPLARLVCQRTNIVWDGQLRQRYSTIILVFTLGLVVATLVHALLTGFTILDYLLTFLPAMPAVILGAEVVKGQRAAVARLDELQELVHSFWKEALSGQLTDEDCVTQGRALQDHILISRKHNPLVSETIYQYLRNPYEADSWESAERLIQEALEATEQGAEELQTS